MRNWSGHLEFSSTSFAEPTSMDDLQSLVATTPHIRALGTGHSFNDVADTSGAHVSVAGLPQGLTVDASARTAWVPAGMRYGAMARELDAAGWAVHNMASLGHISVAGTIATGTHGSGDRNPTLSASVVALELVTAAGDVIVIDDADLPGAVVSLGLLGVVTRVALRIEPRFDIRQYVFDDVPHSEVEAAFDEIFSVAYSVSFFTTWSSSGTGQVWMKRREGTDAPWSAQDWHGGRLADAKRHPLPGHDAMHCTEQGGLVGPWHERLPHFRLDFTPSSGDELQTEYLLPRTAAIDALRAVSSLAPRLHPVLHVSEVRTMCHDELWLSGAYGHDTLGVHFTWRKVPEVLALLPELDAILAPLGGRPHWGKLFAPTTPVADRYPKMDAFRRLVVELDPHGKFRNRFTTDLLALA
jgi:xylitol oxidase